MTPTLSDPNCHDLEGFDPNHSPVLVVVQAAVMRLKAGPNNVGTNQAQQVSPSQRYNCCHAVTTAVN
jgi:hypothetical protein